MKKKVVMLLLVTSMITSMLVGCRDKTPTLSENETLDPSTSVVDEPSKSGPEDTKQPLAELTLPLVNEPTTLTLGVPDFENVEDYETNAFTLWIEEQTGVNLEFIYLPNNSEESLQQVTLMAIGNEKLPDIIWGQHGWRAESVYEMGEQGFFLDLTELVEYYAPTYKAQVAKLTDAQQARINSVVVDPNDGGWYGMPFFSNVGYDTAQSVMWINQVWLDKLELKIPTTIEELYKVCEAFATQDPNGNGKADEIPMVGMADAITGFVANAYDYMNFKVNTTYWMNVDDNGKLYSVFTTDEYREAMKKIKDMTDKGYINTMTYTMEQWAELKNLTCSAATTESTVGIFAGNPVLSTVKGDLRFLEYSAMTELKGETEKGGYYVVNPNGLSLTTFITKDCSNPELAMQLIDFMCSEEAMVRTRYGVKDTDWTFVAGKDFDNSAITDRILNTSIATGNVLSEGNRTWAGRVGHGIQYNKLIVAAAVETDDAWQIHSDKVTAPLRENVSVVAIPKEIIVELPYTADETETVSATIDLLNQRFREARAQFATGILDPNNDADWNKYLSDLESIGLQKFMDVSQAAYDRMSGK